MAQICNPTWRITVQGQPEQKVSRTPSQPVSWSWWCTPAVPAMQETIGGRIPVQGGPQTKMGDPLEALAVMAQVTEHLLRKHEDLTLNPSLKENKKGTFI